MNKKKIIIVLLTALVIIILDHITKWLIVKHVPMGSEFPVIAGIIDIVHGRNTGAAFGFLSGWDSPLRNWFFYAIGVAAIFFLYHYLKTVADNDKISQFALGLVLGGALGNIIDRFFRGSVVDFLSVHYHNEVWRFGMMGYNLVVPLTWPAFNVADSAISVAVVLLVWQNIRQGMNEA